MAEVIPMEGATVFVKDTERLLRMYGAEAGRVDPDGEIEMLVADNGGYAWKRIQDLKPIPVVSPMGNNVMMEGAAVDRLARSQPRFPPAANCT